MGTPRSPRVRAAPCAGHGGGAPSCFSTSSVPTRPAWARRGFEDGRKEAAAEGMEFDPPEGSSGAPGCEAGAPRGGTLFSMQGEVRPAKKNGACAIWAARLPLREGKMDG
jgi:hypothetical protein